MRLGELLRKSYLKRSRVKYSASREPLETEKAIVVYAHDLDGCPVANVRNRLHPKPKLYRADFDRGDAFEIGFGVVHGLPSGIEIGTLVNDLSEVNRLANGKEIRLKGTPDFVAVIDGDLRILDAKSPRRRTINDGLKGYRVSRLQTYAFIASRLREHDPDFARRLVIEAASRTPRPVDPVYVGERTTGEVKLAVIVDDPSIRSYRIVTVEPDDGAVIARLKRFLLAYAYLTARLSAPDVEEKLKELVEEAKDEFDPDRKRMCSYCERIRCPFSDAEIYMIDGRFVDGPFESKSKTFYRKLRAGDNGVIRKRDKESECRRLVSEPDFLLTSKADLAEHLLLGKRAVVKVSKNGNGSGKRVSLRLPARPEFVEVDREC